MKAKTARKLIAEYSKLLYEQGYSVDSEGNISIRLSENRILITPSNLLKKHVRPADIVEINMEGEKTAGKRKATTERFTHIEVYKQNPDIRAVVHSHPPYVLAASVLGQNPFERPFLSEAAMFLSDVRWAPYARPSTRDGAESIRDICAGTRTIVLDRHGTLTYAKDLQTAFSLLEIMEKVAKIDTITRQGGGSVRYLSDEQIAELRKVEYGK